MSTNAPGHETETEDRQFRELLARNPRPALLWLAGLLVLVALEIGRFFAGIGQVLGIVGFLFDMLSSLPGYVGGNFESVAVESETVQSITGTTVETIVGTGVTWLTAAVMLFVVLLPFGEVVPDSVVNSLAPGFSRRQRRWTKRLVLTAAASGLAAIVFLSPLNAAVPAAVGAVLSGVDSLASSLPSITSRELISNEGHRTPPDGEGWEGPPLGLTPAQAWGLRVAIVITYAAALVAWFWRGYNVYRRHYRQADWTPTDDTLRRFRSNYWGLLGLLIVFLFVVMALWAPAVSPVTAEENIITPAQYELEYFNEETGEVETELRVFANLDDETDSDGQNTVGPLSYDKYDRWQPLGTTNRGQNMMTHLAYGARTSLIIGVSAIGLSALIAVVLSLAAAYYKGVVDLATVVASDTIQVIPLLLLVMMLSVIFQDADHAIAEPLDGGFLLAMIFAVAFWPAMWRTVRGPALQVSEQEWVDAARSYGQRPLAIMRKHMAPYIAGYIMIYASLLLGSIIISVSALTFLGLGINPPTPEWGRLINDGQSFVATSSWHVATVPGLAIVFVVVAFNALGDAIRDAIDPESGVDEGTAAAGGGA